MEFVTEIIIIQKYVRRFLIKKNVLIPSSKYQTKIWRKNRSWYKTGKSNECEKYQINTIEKIIGKKLEKTNDRINFVSYEINNKKNLMMNDDGYEWSENFDGKIISNENIHYFNLKFVCDNGGSQTRTLREVYHFITYQLEYLLKYNTPNTFFVNILDGNTCYENINKFRFLVNNIKYTKIRQNIFVGCIYEFQKSYLLLRRNPDFNGFSP
jgi:hypothetical protein